MQVDEDGRRSCALASNTPPAICTSKIFHSHMPAWAVLHGYAQCPLKSEGGLKLLPMCDHCTRQAATSQSSSGLLTCTHRAGSRYLKPSRGGRLHAVTKRRNAFCWSAVKLSSACIRSMLECWALMLPAGKQDHSSQSVQAPLLQHACSTHGRHILKRCHASRECRIHQSVWGRSTHYRNP